MKQVTAYLLDNGEVFVSHEAAKKAAQHRYDDHMTRLRNQLIQKLNSHQAAGYALEWIEDNFLEISAAQDFRRDATTLINEDDT